MLLKDESKLLILFWLLAGSLLLHCNAPCHHTREEGNLKMNHPAASSGEFDPERLKYGEINKNELSIQNKERTDR
jgi:hypothetical protein